MSFYGWKPYVPVAARRAKAEKLLAKLIKKGLAVQPVEIAARRPIAATFWGKGWCDHMESFRDYDNRLPRGRTYLRNGAVCHLEIRAGKIEAIVSGSSLYKVAIEIKPLPAAKWRAIRTGCSGKIDSLLDLLRGRLASGVMERVCHRTTGLFPLQGEISFQCDCPDWADMCKHVAAVLYGVGARLDQAPEQLFLLRGVDHEELVDIPAAVESATKGGSSARRIEADNVADLFGIELAPEDEPAAEPRPRRAPARGAGKPETARPVATKPVIGKGEKTRLKKSLAAKSTVRPFAAGGQSEHPAKKIPPAAAAPLSFPQRLTGPALRRWREARDLTQTALAGRLGVSASTISQWENKGRKVLRLREEALALLREAWLSGPARE